MACSQPDSYNICAFSFRNAGATWPKKGVSLRADVVFLIIHIALELLKLQSLDSAHTMRHVFKFQLVLRRRAEEERSLHDLSMKYYDKLRAAFMLITIYLVSVSLK